MMLDEAVVVFLGTWVGIPRTVPPYILAAASLRTWALALRLSRLLQKMARLVGVGCPRQTGVQPAEPVHQHQHEMHFCGVPAVWAHKHRSNDVLVAALKHSSNGANFGGKYKVSTQDRETPILPLRAASLWGPTLG